MTDRPCCTDTADHPSSFVSSLYILLVPRIAQLDNTESIHLDHQNAARIKYRPGSVWRPALHRADHIVVLKKGRVEAEERLEELLEGCEEMRRPWEGKVGTA